MSDEEKQEELSEDQQAAQESGRQPDDTVDESAG